MGLLRKTETQLMKRDKNWWTCNIMFLAFATHDEELRSCDEVTCAVVVEEQSYLTCAMLGHINC